MMTKTENIIPMGDLFQEFLDWVSSRPFSETYNFYSLDHCAFAQFGAYKFPADVVIGDATGFNVYSGSDLLCYTVISSNAVPIMQDCRTYGQLASSLRLFAELTK